MHIAADIKDIIRNIQKNLGNDKSAVNRMEYLRTTLRLIVKYFDDKLKDGLPVWPTVTAGQQVVESNRAQLLRAARRNW